MALRDLVMGGGGVCAIPGEGPSSSSNPLANFAGSLLGSTSKTQERLRELPNLPEVGSSTPDFASAPVISLPGSEQELEHLHQTGSKVPQFLRSFHNVDQTAYTSAWNDVTGGGVPAGNQMLHAREQDFVDFERIYAEGGQQEFLNDHPREVLSGFFRSFVNSSREGAPFHAVQLPELGLSGADKQRILDRSSIMGRHFFAEKGDDFVNAQVTALLQSLDIEDNTRMREPLGNRFSELEEYWRGTPPGGTGWAMKNQWAQEYSQQYGVPNKQGSWADEFQAQNESNSWAEQFTQAQGHMPGQIRDMSAMDQTRQLVDTLSRNNDPKFQNSKFLHFVSKMSRGELIVEDNQIKENIANGWANEYDVQHPNWEGKWAAEFTAGEQAYQDGNWVKEFEHGQHAAVQDSWAEEFSLSSAKTWVDEFDEQRFKDNSDPWEDSYDKFVEEQLRGNQASSTSKWIYVFSDENPYVGHPNPMKEGQDLFRKGLLSEAVLALEAEVLKNPQNAEGWRLLGITHAENDDDRQAIASMVHARDADPTNLEVLLALGVSHTNELEQVEALKYLRGWLQYHPKYATLVPAEEVGHLNHAEVTKLFHDAARMAPDDADIHTVLGVLYNLSREYDKAIQAFQTALELKPRDYSLWNKLGATQANSAQSSDAIYAYQQALDLKPNYVRAWTNMGIGYANQAHYEESIPYYVRALCMNPKADNAWQYIRISLSCAGRSDLLAACDSRDLDALQEQFPM